METEGKEEGILHPKRREKFRQKLDAPILEKRENERTTKYEKRSNQKGKHRAQNRLSK